jgi:hypothetical protein
LVSSYSWTVNSQYSNEVQICCVQCCLVNRGRAMPSWQRFDFTADSCLFFRTLVLILLEVLIIFSFWFYLFSMAFPVSNEKVSAYWGRRYFWRCYTDTYGFFFFSAEDWTKELVHSRCKHSTIELYPQTLLLILLKNIFESCLL